MEFHISRRARDRYGTNGLLFSYAGNVLFANPAASRELALRINQQREAEAAGGVPAEPMHAGALFAMGLIDELSHAMIASYRETLDPSVVTDALEWFAAKAGQVGVEKLLTSFTQQFPNVAVYRGEESVAEWLQATTTDGRSNREVAFEELLLLWLANINPAFAPFSELFNDTELQKQTIYSKVTTSLDEYFETRPVVAPEVGTLLDALRAPMLASPDSLTGQLAYIRDQWTEYIGEDLRHVMLAIDVLKEEDVAIWMRFHPPSDSPEAARLRGDRRGQGWSSEGFEGDEYVGFEQTAEEERRLQQARAEQPTIHEYEAFSPDQAWMPTVVLIAKSTYVWLEQLSKKYQRHIHRLDQIPDEELGILADRGMNGLWLIGLWERSIASQTIKRLRGQADAVASAYSVADYRIADDLGGEPAYRTLRDRAAKKGIRLASDMVPNHMGIDSTWVMDHPEWFVSRPESPFPVYRFEGPDLSHDSRYEIKIEDHYFDQTDAAVVFRLRNRSNGHDQFVYHGNDGTTFAWNDTAQLDYSKAFVREQVMQTILAVARLFPIIRFDAAMTLAKKHVQRLWFPLHGVGGSIPSRAESAMTNAEFDALMPNEFWREVVDRVAVEVPGTLLLAEAFWLLEGYFVRTLGMHRVYNSAFMNMLRDEENAKYRSYLKKTIEFDPDILKRYVNFMSNPDERTAIDQFGSGDRYFGVATVLATIPGLPMFGHGQVEGYTEKYGMEYKTAKFDEWPNEDLLARHHREIAPLLKNRKLYAESTNFVLYDFWAENGAVDENVFAFSNRLGDERAIVFFNNRYGETRGTIHVSAESMDKGSGTLRTRKLSEALNLQSDDAVIIAYKDTVSGLEYLRHSRALDHNGLTLDLRAYQYIVLQNWRELRSTAEQPWDALCDSLNGAGVYDLGEAVWQHRLRPLREAVRELLSPHSLQPFIDLVAPEAAAKPQAYDVPGVKPAAEEVSVVKPAAATNVFESEPILQRAQAIFGTIQQFGRETDSNSTEWKSAVKSIAMLASLDAKVAASWPDAARSSLPIGSPWNTYTALWAQVLGWTVLRHLHSDPTRIVAIFDDLQLRTALAQSFAGVGLEGEAAWRAAAWVRLLLIHRPTKPATTVEKLLSSDAFWNDADVRWLAGVTEFEGKVFLNKESFEELVAWVSLPDLLEPSAATALTLERVFVAAKEAAYELPALLKLLATPNGILGVKAPLRAKKTEDPAKKQDVTATALKDAAAPAEEPVLSTVTKR